jgi:uncharacterized YigZ family protein
MPVFSYLTIDGPAEGNYKEKGSKFLAFAYPVTAADEIKGKLDQLKKEYFDARHHCYAYILGPEKNTFRSFDDGEPNHSAGDPILGQIRSRNLTGVLIVVVRYFGGTKLGVGGLVTAYKTAASEALDKTRIIEKDILRTLSFSYPYESTPEIMRLVKDFELTIRSQDFKEHCFLVADYKLKDEALLLEKAEVLKAMGHLVELSDQASGK